MRPTNVLIEDEFLLKVKHDNQNGGFDVKNLKPSAQTRVFKSEKKNATLAAIMNYEHNHFMDTTPAKTEATENTDNENNFTYYEHMDENFNYKIEKEHQVETKYAWAHLSCANFILEIEYTPKSPLKVGRLNPERFMHPCIICCEKKGAAIKCSDEDCDVWLHGE